jgi:hypothetical protein
MEDKKNTGVQNQEIKVQPVKAYQQPELKKHGKLKNKAADVITYTYTYTYIT